MELIAWDASGAVSLNFPASFCEQPEPDPGWLELVKLGSRKEGVPEGHATHFPLSWDCVSFHLNVTGLSIIIGG